MSDVVVTNLHLYGINLASEGAILPEHDLAILDEAHQAEDIVARALAFELRSRRFQALVNRASAILSNSTAVANVADLAGRVDDALAPHVGDRLVPSDLGEVRTVLELAATRLASLRVELLAVPMDGPSDAVARRSRALRSVEVLTGDISAALGVDGGLVGGR